MDQWQMVCDRVIAAVLTVVSEYYGVSVEVIKSSRRGRQEVQEARQMALMLITGLLWEYVNAREIGKRFNRDYMTVRHSHRVVRNKLSVDLSVRADLERILARLYNLLPPQFKMPSWQRAGTTLTSRQEVVDTIIGLVSWFFSVSEKEIRQGKESFREVIHAKAVAVYLIKKYTGLSLYAIGQAFHGKDHSHVIHYLCLVENRMDVDPGFKEAMERLDITVRRTLIPWNP